MFPTRTVPALLALALAAGPALAQTQTQTLHIPRPRPTPSHHAIPRQGTSSRAERGMTRPGISGREAGAIGAEPTAVQPPVPAPTVGATGGRVPYAK